MYKADLRSPHEGTQSERIEFLEDMTTILVRVVTKSPGIKPRAAYKALAREMGIIDSFAQYGLSYAKATHRIKQDWETMTLWIPS